MKTIEKAACEYAGVKVGEYVSCCNDETWCQKYGFIAGAEFAQRWIPMQEERPEVMIKILVKSERRGIDLFKPMDYGDIKWVCETFTHWRLIDFA